MGISVKHESLPISATIFNSVLHYKIGNEEHKISLQNAGEGLFFPTQCNFFMNDKIMSVMYNEKYEMVLFRNGYGEINLKWDKVLCKTFRFEPDSIIFVHNFTFGSLYNPSMKIYEPLFLSDTMLRNSILVSRTQAFSATMRLDENRSLYSYLSEDNILGPCLLFKIDNDGVIQAVDNNGVVLGTLNCNYSVGKHFLDL